LRVASSDLRYLADSKYVALTTFRRPTDGAERGVGVSTPVWIAGVDDRLLVMTQAETGKVKRVRHTPDVALQACTQRGIPRAGAPVVLGSARIRTDAEAFAERDASFTRKYGLIFRLFRLLGRRRSAESVILEITLPA
jgi:PPOX class probable F420-dependent enzyme